MVRNRTREDPITERFLQFFYDSCITSLYKPVLDLPEFKNLTGAYQLNQYVDVDLRFRLTHIEPVLNLHREQDSLLLYLCDLLSTFFVQHTHRSQFFILASNISTRVASLFRAKDKHLRLGVYMFRVYRKLRC
jgi:protein phosphatase-4 regulatory subunit 3